MEKLSCDVICDLLPLYCDDIVSQDSRALVEGHLEGCPKCRELLKKMRTEYQVPDTEEQSREAVVKGMASVWTQSVKRSFLKGVLVAALVCLVSFSAYWSLTRLILTDVAGAQIEASVEQVTEEQIKLSLKVANGKRVSASLTKVTPDGKCYLIIRQAIFAEKNGDGSSWTSDWSLARNYALESGAEVRIREIYCGNEKDGVLVWREE